VQRPPPTPPRAVVCAVERTLLAPWRARWPGTRRATEDTPPPRPCACGAVYVPCSPPELTSTSRGVKPCRASGWPLAGGARRNDRTQGQEPHASRTPSLCPPRMSGEAGVGGEALRALQQGFQGFFGGGTGGPSWPLAGHPNSHSSGEPDGSVTARCVRPCMCTPPTCVCPIARAPRASPTADRSRGIWGKHAEEMAHEGEGCCRCARQGSRRRRTTSSPPPHG
jgi:hypothetical protein